MFVNGKEKYKYEADNKNINFPTQFILWSISNGFSANESREVSLNGNVCDFSVDYNSIDKYDMVSINKYLTNKNNMKKYSALLNKCLLYLLSFSESLVRNQTKCLFLNDEPCMVIPTLIDLDPFELKCYPLTNSLNKCTESCNVFSPKICLSKERKDINDLIW